MRIVLIAPLAAALIAAAPPAKEPVTGREVSAGDVATTPVSDLNLRKDDIPPLLLAAQEKPYDLAGLRRCNQIVRAVGALDALLGTDIDVPQEAARGTTTGRVAQSVVGSFIPFRGVIREISGASGQERRFQAAIYAGIARRSFLKGVGLQRGCRYPARPAPAGVVSRAAAALKDD